jgi:fatty-acyl-CoA synthase
MTTGYFNKPEETNATISRDGWVRSGDIGRVASDGFLQVTGRYKDVYRCGGETVAPIEVEEILLNHPTVEQAYVVAIPDDRMGEIGVAWVVQADDLSVSDADLQAFCRLSLASYKVPRYIFRLSASDLPLTPSGKVQKFKLAERALDSLFKDATSPPAREIQEITKEA